MNAKSRIRKLELQTGADFPDYTPLIRWMDALSLNDMRILASGVDELDLHLPDHITSEYAARRAVELLAQSPGPIPTTLEEMREMDRQRRVLMDGS